MEKQLSDSERGYIETFEKSDDFAQIPEDVRRMYRDNLRAPGKLAFVAAISDQLTHLTAEDWRRQSEQIETRNWILRDRARRIANDILTQQAANDSWIRRYYNRESQANAER